MSLEVGCSEVSPHLWKSDISIHCEMFLWFGCQDEVFSVSSDWEINLEERKIVGFFWPILNFSQSCQTTMGFHVLSHMEQKLLDCVSCKDSGLGIIQARVECLGYFDPPTTQIWLGERYAHTSPAGFQVPSPTGKLFRIILPGPRFPCWVHWCRGKKKKTLNGAVVNFLSHVKLYWFCGFYPTGSKPAEKGDEKYAQQGVSGPHPDQLTSKLRTVKNRVLDDISYKSLEIDGQELSTWYTWQWGKLSHIIQSVK